MARGSIGLVTSRKSSTILVVEDQPANLLLARASLVRAGFRVVEATNADEARMQVDEQTPDLILMDIGLPGQDGLSLTRELKSNGQLAGVPIVALTAHATTEDQLRARAAGCDGFVSKPFSPRHLVDVVAELLPLVSITRASRKSRSE